MGVIWHKKRENHYKAGFPWREDLQYSHFPGEELLLSHLSGAMAMVKRHYVTPQPLTMQVNHN